MGLAAQLMLAACATDADRARPAAQEGYCDLTAEELADVQARALAFLLQEWPALEESCEVMSDAIRELDDGQCAIYGAPRKTDECARTSHAGYSVVFSRDTLEPVQIYFMSE